ncbi:MAG: carbohydrate ABC transporter substrate-binding protein, partial [Verrucomicrobia bacterium]|nr:carbohydrate ABC transporter substrate-binding protein [Verrucomicrobiota bacterium]
MPSSSPLKVLVRPNWGWRNDVEHQTSRHRSRSSPGSVWCKKLELGILGLLFVLWFSTFTCRAADENKLEVFSWWTSGGEAAALEALFSVFKAQNPGVDIVNAAVAGGGGSAARPVLQTRLAGGNPPDTWQTHPGLELMDQYVAPGYGEPVTDLYKTNGWDSAFPKNLVASMMTRDRKIYAVLAGVHRGNVLWYNTKLLEANGIKIN